MQIDAAVGDGRRTLVATDETWVQAPGRLVKDSFLIGEICDGRLDPLRRDLAEDDIAWKPVALSGENPGARWNFIPPERVIRRVPAVEVFSPAEGVWVFDLGELISGTLEWREPEAMASGDTVVFHIAQHLMRDGLDSPFDAARYPDGTKITDPQRMISRGGRMFTVGTEFFRDFAADHPPLPKKDIGLLKREMTLTDLYRCSGTPGTVWTSSARTHAFRYVEVSGLKEKPSPEQLAGLFIHTDVEEIGGFESANPVLNAFDERCRHVQILNIHGYLSDCHDAEKTPWNESANCQSRSSYFMHDMTGPLRKMTLDNNRSALKFGRPANHSSSWVSVQSPVWQSAMIKLPWYQYLYRGDLRSVREVYEGMMKFLRYYFPGDLSKPIESPHVPDHLSAQHSAGKQSRRGNSGFQKVAEAALFLDVARKTGKLARLFGRDADAEWCDQLSVSMRSLLLDEYWSEDRQTFSDNPEYEGMGTDCEDGFAGALLKDDPEIRRKLVDFLVRQLEERDYAPLSGIVTFTYYLDLMADHDQADAIYRMFNREGPQASST
jgi:alpha-L-rhamnosidase